MQRLHSQVKVKLDFTLSQRQELGVV
jgi:hypothetical protein